MGTVGLAGIRLVDDSLAATCNMAQMETALKFAALASDSLGPWPRPWHWLPVLSRE